MIHVLMNQVNALFAWLTCNYILYHIDDEFIKNQLHVHTKQSNKLCLVFPVPISHIKEINNLSKPSSIFSQLVKN